MNERLFRTLYIILFLLIVVFPSTTHAQTKRIVEVEEGTTVPFDGVLLSVEAFAELKVSSELKKEEIDLFSTYKVDSALLESQLKIDNLELRLEIREEAYKERLTIKNQRIDDLYEALEKETKQTVWERLKGPANFLGGVALSIGIFYIHSQLVSISYE